MTNLTSEQYRDVLKSIPNATVDIPNAHNLLRRAVILFFRRFGSYPEVAGAAPGKVGLFGEQIQFDDGVAVPVATPMMTVVVGKKVFGKRCSVVTALDVGKPHKVSFSFSPKRPLAPGCPKWLNCIKGVIDSYDLPVPSFEAAVESSLPQGDKFGSIPSLEVAFYTFLEILVGKKSDIIDKARVLEKAEAKFGTRKIGLLDRITSISAKDRSLMVIDCRTNEILAVPFTHPEVRLVAVDLHVNHGQNIFPELTKYLNKACQLLGIQNLRHYDEEDLEDFELRLKEIIEEKMLEATEEQEMGGESEEDEEKSEIWSPEEYDVMMKRARFFLKELKIIKQAIEAVTEGDIEVFGEKMTESQQNLRDDFDFDDPFLNFFVDVSLEVEGVLGSRVTGMGPSLGIVSLVERDKIKDYCSYVTERFQENEYVLTQEVMEVLQNDKNKQHQINKALRNTDLRLSVPNEREGKGRNSLKSGVSAKEEKDNRNCFERKTVPCIQTQAKQGRCGTYSHFEILPEKDSFDKRSEEESINGEEEYGEDVPSIMSEVSTVHLRKPTFYIISPFAGARMMFVTKPDYIRSPYAAPIPHPKELVRSAIKVFKSTYDRDVEMISLTAGSVFLFGDFLEYHLGNLICMALPQYVATVGGRNDSIFFSVKTTLPEMKDHSTVKYPVPSVQIADLESRDWVNHVLCVVNEFKDHVPGFDAVIHSAVPSKVGLNSNAAFHSCVHIHMEQLTRRCPEDAFSRIERCQKSEMEAEPDELQLIDHCSSIKYFPIFLCKEGHLTCIDCKNSEISNYFFDDPRYVFLIVCCKKRARITTYDLEERLKSCMDAINILGRVSLLNLDLKHLKCLKKRDAPGLVVKRAKYVIKEHQRTIEAIKAIQEQDYPRVGMLMTQSHVSLRDDYEVSSPEIEELFRLATRVDGVLGAKMLGKGITTSLIVLLEIMSLDKCIKFIRRNYSDKKDKPTFYVTKPSEGAFTMDPKVDLPYIL